MYQKYSIGTMAKLMGISSEAIRYYESRNIISPVRDPETGYRYYNTWDFHMLLRARHYQNYGFSLEEIAELFRIEERPGIYRMNTQKNYTLFKKKEQLDLISEWTEKEPFVFSCAVFYQKNIEKGETEFDFGMGLREEYAQFLNVKESELVQYYPPCLCVHTCVPSRSGKYLSLESLKEGFRYLEQNGLSLAGDIVTQVACMTKPEEEYFNWHIVWFPIKEA